MSEGVASFKGWWVRNRMGGGWGRRGEDESLFACGEVGCWDTGGWLWTVYYFPIKGTEFVHRSSCFLPGPLWEFHHEEKWEQSTDWKYGWSSSTHSGSYSSCYPHMWGLENTAKRNKTLHNANNGFIHGAQNAKKGLFWCDQWTFVLRFIV